MKEDRKTEDGSGATHIPEGQAAKLDLPGAQCDICGADLLLAEVRYIVSIEVFAAYDPLELTRSDMERDYEEEMRKLVEQLRKSKASGKEMEESVYARRRFDLCASCAKKYLASPMPRNGK